MQQVCSWCAHDHDIHVQEHALTHTGPALGECHNHSVGCICFDVAMVSIFPVFPVPDRVLPGPVCLCGYVFLCMHTRGHVHEAQHACRVLLLFFGVCPCPSGLCVCCPLPGHRCRASARAQPWLCVLLWGWSQVCAVGTGSPALTVPGLLHGMRVQTPRLPPSAERGKMEKVPHGARRFFFINKGIWGQLEHE